MSCPLRKYIQDSNMLQDEILSILSVLGVYFTSIKGSTLKRRVQLARAINAIVIAWLLLLRLYNDSSKFSKCKT